MSFGKIIDPNDALIRPLEMQGIMRLYPPTTYSTANSPNNLNSNYKPNSININNHKKELKKLNHSILIAYLDLLEILVKAPNTQIQIEQTPDQHDENDTDALKPQITYKTLREQKLEDIELLFINMHHLINELRPHQARDNLRCILEMQKQQRVDTAQKFKTHLYKIVQLLKNCIDSFQTERSNVLLSTEFDPPNSISSLENLNKLIKSANQINQALDKFTNHNSNNFNSSSKKNLLKLNGVINNNNNLNVHLNNHYHDDTCDDIEMRSENGENSETESKFNLKSNINNNNDKYPSHFNNNCDFRDLILCDLIDDYLLKENEF
jgi:mediator of RNA polymerase II transcription subunit 7